MVSAVNVPNGTKTSRHSRRTSGSLHVVRTDTERVRSRSAAGGVRSETQSHAAVTTPTTASTASAGRSETAVERANAAIMPANVAADAAAIPFARSAGAR